MKFNIKYVFVYGTLKTDGRLFHLLEPYTKKVTSGVVRNAALYDVACGAFPGIVLNSTDRHVVGELHEINNMAATLKILDSVEGYHGENEQNHYNRKIATIHSEFGEIPAFIYEYARDIGEKDLIKSGIWDNK